MQPGTLEMFHMRENFFDPGGLMQVHDKTDATLTQVPVVFSF